MYPTIPSTTFPDIVRGENKTQKQQRDAFQLGFHSWIAPWAKADGKLLHAIKINPLYCPLSPARVHSLSPSISVSLLGTTISDVLLNLMNEFNFVRFFSCFAVYTIQIHKQSTHRCTHKHTYSYIYIYMKERKEGSAQRSRQCQRFH